MIIKTIDLPIGLEDSEFISYAKKDAFFFMYIKLWNEKKMEVSFEDAIRILDKDLGDISSFGVVSGDSTFLQDAMASLYVNVPINHEYYHFQFYNLDDIPTIELIAKSYKISIQS